MGSCVSCIICTIDVYRTYILVQFLYFDPDSTIPLQSSWKKLMVYRLFLLLMIWSLLCYVNSCWLTAYFASNFPYCSKPRNRELKNIWPYVSLCMQNILFQRWVRAKRKDVECGHLLCCSTIQLLPCCSTQESSLWLQVLMTCCLYLNCFRTMSALAWKS